MPPRSTATILARNRKLCLALPEVTERLSHGAPCFFVGKGSKSRCFLMWADNHHGDGRLAVWIASTKIAQHEHVTTRPEQFFVPAYVGPRGWLGVRLDRDLEWEEIGQLIEDAFLQKARPGV